MAPGLLIPGKTIGMFPRHHSGLIVPSGPSGPLLSGSAHASASGFTNTSLGVIIPSAASVGDLALLGVGFAGATATVTATGWTLVGNIGAAGTSMQLNVYKRTLIAGDPGSTLTVSFSAGNTIGLTMTTWKGGQGLVGITGFSYPGVVQATSCAMPTITPTHACKLISICTVGNTTQPSGFTMPNTLDDMCASVTYIQDATSHLSAAANVATSPGNATFNTQYWCSSSLEVY